jgi:Histidine kinase
MLLAMRPRLGQRLLSVPAARHAVARPGAASAAAGFGLPERRWAERRPVVLAAATGLYGGVFALRATVGDAADAIGLLYVIPIALVALELGLRAGVAAAALALGLVGVWALDAHADLGAAGVTTRGVAYLAVGGVAGRFSDRMRNAQQRQAALLESGFALAHLAAGDEPAGTLARHAAHLVGARGARVDLNGRPRGEWGVLDHSDQEVPIEARGIRHGTLAVSASRRLQPEDRAALAIVALQAAVSQENQRLLESERERAAIRAELRDAHRRLDERAVQLRELLVGQEAERRHVSYELREQAAQMLAAVLLGLGALERQLGSEIAAPQVGVLRSHVDETMRSLRALAVSLRPPTLELGLKTALERLADHARERGPVELTVALDDATRLGEEIETTIYRVVEEALDAADGAPRSLTVTTEPGDRRVTILLEAGDRPIDRDKLALLTARLELVRGTLSSSTTGLQAVIPLVPDHEPARVTAAGAN